MIDPIQILLQTTTVPSVGGAGGYLTYCTFADLDLNGWVQIVVFVMAINFAIASILYAMSGILPTAYREKIRAAVKYEAFQGFIGVIMLVILIASSAAVCNIGHLLVFSDTSQHYQNPIQYSEVYLSNLMFNTGLGLFSSIYSESILLTLSGNIADTLEQLLQELTVIPTLHFSLGTGLLGVYFGFGGALTSTFLALISVAFGVLFLVYLLLPFIQQLAFTIVLPIALIMRCIPFAGPNLRQTSDTFLGLAVGFYFIFPLMILFNNFVVTWIFTPCTGVGPSPALCNPYAQYNAPYGLANLPISTLFTTNPTTITKASNGFLGGISLPNSFLSSSYNGYGGFGSGVQIIIENLYRLPYIIIGFAQKTAVYLFESIFMIGLDIAITVGFAMGLSKGIASAGRMLGVGPFWGNY